MHAGSKQRKQKLCDVKVQEWIADLKKKGYWICSNVSIGSKAVMSTYLPIFELFFNLFILLFLYFYV